MRRIVNIALGLGLVCSGMAAHAQTPATSTSPPILVATPGVTAKVDGRLFTGMVDTQRDGEFPTPTLDLPDAKLRFTFAPSTTITVVSRFDLKRATVTGVDYLYVDVNDWAGKQPKHLIRIGRQKIDVGEETWSDNPVEGILITNSVSAIGGTDEGISFRGPLPTSRPATYALGVYNASSGVAPSAEGLAGTAKVGLAVTDHLYMSASMLSTGDLVKTSGEVLGSDLKFAGLTTAPTGATGWSRRLWEIDARWNYGKTGVKSVVGAAPTDRFQLGAAVGHFTDDIAGAADREADYWYVEGLYNASSRLYLASRYSKVGLDDAATAKLVGSPVAVNEYTRLSLGAGYRLSPRTHLKVEFTNNATSGGATTPELDQYAIGIATKF